MAPGLRVAFTAIALVLLVATGADAKKKRVKTTFKELKCSACKTPQGLKTMSVRFWVQAVASEFGENIVANWEKHKGDTILIEKRKKKTKVLYQESELSIQEAVDHTCDSEDRFKKFNVTSVGGRPEYTKVQGKVAKTEYKKQLAGMCQTLLAEHEPEIVKFFFQNQEWQGDPAVGPREVCLGIAGYCREQDLAPADGAAGAGDAGDAKAEL